MAESANIADAWQPAPRRREGLGQAWRRLARHRPAVVGAAVIGVYLLAALFADVLAPYDPLDMSAGSRLTGPDAAHWFGTDEFGRDVLSRVIYGARIAFVVGVLSASGAAVVGMMVGGARGIFRRVDGSRRHHAHRSRLCVSDDPACRRSGGFSHRRGDAAGRTGHHRLVRGAGAALRARGARRHAGGQSAAVCGSGSGTRRFSPPDHPQSHPAQRRSTASRPVRPVLLLRHPRGILPELSRRGSPASGAFLGRDADRCLRLRGAGRPGRRSFPEWRSRSSSWVSTFWATDSGISSTPPAARVDRRVGLPAAMTGRGDRPVGLPAA